MKNARAGIALLVIQIVSVLYAVVWAIFTLFSLLMLEQVDDLNGLQSLCLYVLWCYPLAFIGAGIASWVMYHKRRFQPSVWVGGIPLLWVLPLVIFYA